MIAHAIIFNKLAGGVNITASHNPWDYNGLKYSGPEGGPPPSGYFPPPPSGHWPEPPPSAAYPPAYEALPPVSSVRPPEPPQTSTASFFWSVLPCQPKSIR